MTYRRIVVIDKNNFCVSYHYLSHPGEIKPGVSCEIDKFKAQMAWLKDNNYNVLSLSNVVERIKNNQSLPDKLASIAFDDGLRDGYDIAFPILKKFGFPATFLVISSILKGKIPPVIAFQILIRELGAEKLEYKILPEVLKGIPYATLLDSKRYDIADAKRPEPEEMRRIKWIFNHFLPTGFKLDVLEEMFRMLGKNAEQRFCREFFISPEEIKEMANNGIDFASHTVTHPPFDICGSEDVEFESLKSKEMLEEVINKPVTVFGWPFGGQFSERARNIIRKHYNGACNFAQGSINDLYNLPRDDQAEIFKGLI